MGICCLLNIFNDWNINWKVVILTMTILERILSIKLIRLNIYKSWSLAINKKTLEKVGFKEGDWVQIIPKKNKIIFVKYNGFLKKELIGLR